MLHDRHAPYSPALGPDKNRYLRQELLQWESDLETSSLEKRGWPFIERVFAPRSVYFGNHQMMWECASGLQYEASKHNSTIGSGQIRTRYRRKIIQPNIEKALSGHTENQDTGATTNLDRYKTWHQCVDEFLGRELKRPADKLTAMAPLASILDDSMGTYLAGIWSSNVAVGLAWALFLPARPHTEHQVGAGPASTARLAQTYYRGQRT